MKPVISVIIPALNEERALPACLEALASQTLPVDRFEVVLVDNGSTDRTLQIAQRFASRLALRICERRRCSIAALRNRGAGEARGTYLAFLDADCVPRRSWLEFALHLLTNSSDGIVGAAYQIPDRSGWVARAWYGGQHKKSGSVSYLSGGNLILSRQAFAKTGGFNEQMETSEDWEFCQRARSRAIPVTAFPNLAVVHLGTPQTLREFTLKQYWHGTHALKAVLHAANAWSVGRAAWLAVWTLISVLACFFCLAATALGAGVGFAAIGCCALFAAPVVLSARTALARGSVAVVFPLMVLYLTYGLARALCVAGFTLPRPAKPVVPDSLTG